MVTCETCQKQFANNWGLKVHIARTHEKKKNAEAKAAAAEATGTPTVAKAKKVPVVVQFCPCCGLNMAAVTVAVNYARK